MEDASRLLRAASDGRDGADKARMLALPILLSFLPLYLALLARHHLRDLRVTLEYVKIRATVLVHTKEDPLPVPDLTKHVEFLINGIASSLNVCFVVFYFASGAAAFCWHERWWRPARRRLGARRGGARRSVSESLCYLVSTACGGVFGDLAPASTTGRLCACLYAPAGVLAFLRIAHVLSKRLSRALATAEARLFPGAPPPPSALDAREFSPAEATAFAQRPSRRFVKATLPFLGALLAFLAHQRAAGGRGNAARPWAQALYATAQTAAAVGSPGYPHTLDQRGAALLLVPLLVGSAFHLVREALRLRVQRRAELGCLRPDVERAAARRAGSVTEDAFVLAALEEHGLVDSEVVHALRRQFHYEATLASEDSRAIDAAAAYALAKEHLDEGEAALSLEAWTEAHWEPALARHRERDAAARESLWRKPEAKARAERTRVHAASFSGEVYAGAGAAARKPEPRARSGGWFRRREGAYAPEETHETTVVQDLTTPLRLRPPEAPLSLDSADPDSPTAEAPEADLAALGTLSAGELGAVAAFGGRKLGGGFGSLASTMARVKKKVNERLPIFVLYQTDGRVERACFRANADKVQGMGDRARQAIVGKFFQQRPHLGVEDASAYVARADTALCDRDRDEKKHREGTVVLEVVRRV